MPFHLEREIPAALSAEVFLSIGTSGTVYPAAGFVIAAIEQGSLTVEINSSPTPAGAYLFDIQLAGASGLGRKTYGVDQLVLGAGQKAGIALMALGGAFALAGGVTWATSLLSLLRADRPDRPA